MIRGPARPGHRFEGGDFDLRWRPPLSPAVRGLALRCHGRIAGAMKWAAVLTLALALRLVDWSHVAPDDPSGPPFDGDCLYHRFRAEQIARDFPHVAWKDPLLGDGGIDIPWPPLFDVIVAGAALLTYGKPTPAEVARVADWAPVIIGVATVPLVGWLAAILVGPELAVGAALLFALSVPHAFYSLLGRSDQHVLELFLTLTILIAYARGLHARASRERWVMALLLGVAMVLSFWNWLGSALNLLFLAAFVAAWHVLAPREAPRTTVPAALLAAGCLIGTIALAGTIAFFGPAGALSRASVLGVTGLHVLLIAGTGALATGLWWARRLNPDAPAWRRMAELLLLALAPLTATACVPGALDGIAHGLTALFRSNPWYAAIGEFKPLIFSGQPLSGELGHALLQYGLAPVLAIAGAAALRDRWRREPSSRPEVLLLGVWGGASFALAIARYRFALYAAPPLAIWSWLGLRFAQERWLPGLSRGHLGGAFVVLGIVAASAAPIVAFVRNYAFEPRGPDPGTLLTWLRERPDPTGAPTVYAQWDLGHHVRVLARRPAVANPFGTEGGARGFEESQRVFLSTDEQEVEQALRGRRAGYFLVEDPRSDDRALISYRLHAHDGAAVDGLPALGGFRLLRETRAADPASSTRPAYALFGFVPGARLAVTGATPGAEVTASIRVRADTGREFTWRTTARADSQGTTALRVPYATGLNGSSVAGRYDVSVGGFTSSVEVPESLVLRGNGVLIAFRSPEAATGRTGRRRSGVAMEVDSR